MTTEQLNEFYLLSTTLSYSETSEKLYISQSTLSRHIKDMEEELGVHLFSRTTRNVVLTNEGKYFRTQIPNLLRRAMEIESILSLESVEANGKVRISFSAQTLNSRVMQFLQDFQKQYENVNLEPEPLTMDSDIDLIYSTDIMLSPCDFTRILPADINAMLVTTQPALLAIPPYHHFSEEHSVSLFDLRNETLIVPHEDDPAGPYSQLSFMATRKCYGHLAKTVTSTADQALLLVELGRGVMILPHHLKSHAYPHTQTIAISDPECFFPIYAYHNQSNDNGAAVLFFRSMMKYFQEKIFESPAD